MYYNIFHTNVKHFYYRKWSTGAEGTQDPSTAIILLKLKSYQMELNPNSKSNTSLTIHIIYSTYIFHTIFPIDWIVPKGHHQTTAEIPIWCAEALQGTEVNSGISLAASSSFPGCQSLGLYVTWPKIMVPISRPHHLWSQEILCNPRWWHWGEPGRGHWKRRAPWLW